MPTQTLPAISLRQKEIVKDYLAQLDKAHCRFEKRSSRKHFRIKDLADLLHIHPRKHCSTWPCRNGFQ